MKKRKSLGPGFIDELSIVTVSSAHFKPQVEEDWEDALLSNFKPYFFKPYFDDKISLWRPTVLFCLSVAIFFAIFLRLFHLQIVKGEENRNLAEGNRVQIKVTHAPRGVIYDRNGKILAQSEPGFRLVEGKITYLTRDDVVKMEVSGDPKLTNLEIDSIRTYPLKEKTAHVLGYVGDITTEELKDQRFAGYSLSDKVGRGGVEQSYEKLLRGVNGGEVVEVDSFGMKLRTLRKLDPIPGQSLTLTLDADLQVTAFETQVKAVQASGSCCGAVVVENPTSGEILAMVSLPTFSPHDVSPYLSASDSPILNRAIAGRYPPGSIFKIASALGGLSSGKITSQTEVLDTGVISLGPFTFSNWYFTQYGKTEGMVNMVKALKRSNDIFFYRLGESVGENVLASAARKLGLGSKTNIDIPGEEVGIVPDGDWKKKTLGEIWFPGDTLHMAIGQGFVTVTPLEISSMISTVAMNGRFFQPHLNLKKDLPVGRQVGFRKEDFGLVKTGLAEVPKQGGTAWPFFSFPIETAGKTGTAEFGDPRNRTHAWYTSYAPADDPKIAVTVLMEGGGEGSSVAAPVAKEIYRWYFSQDKNNLIKDVYPVATESARTLGE